MDRRAFLKRSLSSGVLGCSAAASPLITPVTFASLPNGLAGEKRLVVIILRGAMDGLDVVRPVGDPEFAGLRTAIDDGQQGMPLDGFYELHPQLSSLMPLWQAGELGFAHAVATPYRDKRSHFDGQDMLETGVATVDDVRSNDGWLNRMLTLVPGARAETAFAVGRNQMTVLAGKAPHRVWVPNT
ncbi:MAG: twin-arginine translocation pathway signal, partial [Pseudomonadota bacterium]